MRSTRKIGWMKPSSNSASSYLRSVSCSSSMLSYFSWYAAACSLLWNVKLARIDTCGRRLTPSAFGATELCRSPFYQPRKEANLESCWNLPTSIAECAAFYYC